MDSSQLQYRDCKYDAEERDLKISRECLVDLGLGFSHLERSEEKPN